MASGILMNIDVIRIPGKIALHESAPTGIVYSVGALS